MSTTINKQDSQITEQTTKISSLEKENKELESDIASLERKIKGNVATKTLDEAREFLSSSKSKTYNASSKYNANTNVIVVEIGKTATLSVTCTLDDTIWLDSNNSNVTAQWNKDWSYDVCTVSVKGVRAGTSILSFTAENSSKAFDVLVIVI